MIEPAVRRHYEEGVELQRLTRGTGHLELVRTQDILARLLPRSPATILDVGGGPGIYSSWLTQIGYEAHLVDPVPLHVERARKTSPPPKSASLGDARSIPREISSADVVLLMGPLYHLTDRADRIAALLEAARVLRPGGLVFGVGISKFASLLDGIREHHLDHPAFQTIVERDLREGQHRNPDNRPEWFTTAYFHHPDELTLEFNEAGLRVERTLAIEGPAWLLAGLDEDWKDEGRRSRILQGLRAIEEEPSLLGASAHFVAVGRRPG